MPDWQFTQQDASYAHSLNCTRCGRTFIKEIKAGDPMEPQRKRWTDTSYMCRPCKKAINFYTFLIAGGVVAIFAIIFILLG